MGHTVTAALVIAKRQDGSDLYLYTGAELPDHLPAADVKRLVDSGMVSSSKATRKPSAESN